MSILIKDKIAIVTDCNPFESTRQLALANELCRHLNEAGHDSYVIKVPVDWHNGDSLMQSILSLRLLKIMNADAVMAIDFPAAIVQHHNKYAWLTGATEDIAEQRFKENMLQLRKTEKIDATQIPHRLSILQDLLIRMENSYLVECRKIVYCRNAIADGNLSAFDKGNEFSELTNVLKTSLDSLQSHSHTESQESCTTLTVPELELNDHGQFTELPWTQIATFLTRTLEIS